MVEAYDKFVKSKLKHGVFNIGGGPKNTVSLLEFISMIENKTGKKTAASFTDWRPSDQKVYISDISKVNKKLKWQPKTGVGEGLEKVLKWVRNNIKMFK